MDFNDLPDRINSLLGRQDLDVHVPGWLELLEGMIRRDVRHWRMENRAIVTHSERYLSIPADWVETIRIQVQGENPMELLSRTAMQVKRSENHDTGGSPRFYRHSESAFELYPTPADEVTIELEYYQRIPILSQQNPSNWLILDNPDLYLYGTAMHSAPHLHDDTRISTWAALYSAAVQRVNEESIKSETSGSGLRLRNRGMMQSRVPR